MQDLDDGVRVRRGDLSAAHGEAQTKVRPFVDEISIVPAHRLIDVAAACCRKGPARCTPTSGISTRPTATPSSI